MSSQQHKTIVEGLKELVKMRLSELRDSLQTLEKNPSFEFYKPCTEYLEAHRFARPYLSGEENAKYRREYFEIVEKSHQIRRSKVS